MIESTSSSETTTTTIIFSEWPEEVTVEVSLFLTASEVQYGMARVCKKWRHVFQKNAFPAWRRTCFEEFGCDPILPEQHTSWSEWITQLRDLVRFGMEENRGNENERRLHRGNVVLPFDFHFRFKGKYVTSQSYFQMQINKRRAELTLELVEKTQQLQQQHQQTQRCFFTTSSSNMQDKVRTYNQRREMADIVMSLRALALEQRDLERTYRRYMRSERLRRMQVEEESYRRSRTSDARTALTRICNRLSVALAEGPPRSASVALRLAETADNELLQLLPDSDMLGNDKARCLELRRICRAHLKELEGYAKGGYCSEQEETSSNHNSLNQHQSSSSSEATEVVTKMWPEWVVVEVSLFLTLLEAQRGMARVCSEWRRVFLHDLPAWRRICFNEFGCDPILPSGLTWGEWITQLRYMVELGMNNEEQHYYNRFFWERGLHSGNVVLPYDFHFRFSSHYIDLESKLMKEIDERRYQLSFELATMASSSSVGNGTNRHGSSCSSSRNRRKDRSSSQCRAMVDKIMNLRSLASEQREIEVTYRRYKQEEKLRRIQQEEKSYRISRTSKARKILTRIQNELTAALLKEQQRQRQYRVMRRQRQYTYSLTRLAAMVDNELLQILPDSDMLGYDKARCQELRQICRSLVRELQCKASCSVEEDSDDYDVERSSPPRKRRS